MFNIRNVIFIYLLNVNMIIVIIQNGGFRFPRLTLKIGGSLMTKPKSFLMELLMETWVPLELGVSSIPGLGKEKSISVGALGRALIIKQKY